MVSLWHLQVPDDQELPSIWAKYFREHCCLDSKIDEQRDGTGLSRRDFLIELILSDSVKPPGPGVQAGDFIEILYNAESDRYSTTSFASTSTKAHHDIFVFRSRT